MLRFIALWFLVRILGRLPGPILYKAADAGGSLAWYSSTRLRRTTRDHMRHVLYTNTGYADTKIVDRASRGCVRSAALYYADFGRSAHLSQEQAFSGAEMFDGIDMFFDAYDKGCGVIMVSAHLGSPEFIFRSARLLGLDMLVLTERLYPPPVNDLVHQVRNAPGVRFRPAERAGLRETLEQLRSGGIVAVLADRDIQGGGYGVSFFGERTTLPVGPVELALRTNAALMPVFGTRTGVGRYRVTFCPPLNIHYSGDRKADLEAGMRSLAKSLQQGISMAPDQWFVMSPVWSGLAR